MKHTAAMPKILLFEDNYELSEMFFFVLASHNLAIATASVKTAFLEQVKCNRPDLILIDVKLGDFDGRDVCKELKENIETASLPVILMSANPQLLESYKDYKADDYIEKPFSITALLTKINYLLEIGSMA